MKGNVINLNTLHLNSVRLNGIGKVQSVSLKGGSTEDPVFPPIEPPIEPEPTPTYTLSASVTNGMVSATRNGSAVNLPFTANEGDTIVLEVTPNDGYAFEGWADGNTDNPRTITMNADVALSAQCVEVVQPPVGNYIQFEDKAVEAICVANWSSDGIGLTEEDAAKVTDIGTKFNGNTEITSFEELRYFTGLTYISGGALANSAFRNCINLKKIVIPRNVTDVKGYAMDGCSSLEDVIFEDADKITTIGTYAFRSTKATGELSFPNLETMDEGAFVATKVKKLVNLGKITSLKGGGLYTGIINNNSEVEFVDIPQSVSSIDAYYFARCYNLATIICRPTTPPSLGSNFLYNVSWQTQTTIYVPDASLEAYRTALNWNTYADRIHPLSEIEGDDSRLDYIHDSMLMWLDGIDKGTIKGEWQDLVGNNNFVNHGAVELANGYQFNGKSFMQLALGSSPMQWSDHTTLEVVVEFAGNNTYDIILVSGYQNGLAFGRTSSQLLVASNNERPAYADPLAGYAAGKAVVAVNKNTALYNGSPLTTQGSNYFGDIDRTMLGLWMKTGSYFKGTIHAIRIHNRILSEEEILYNQRIDNKRFNLGLDI